MTTCFISKRICVCGSSVSFRYCQMLSRSWKHLWNIVEYCIFHCSCKKMLNLFVTRSSECAAGPANWKMSLILVYKAPIFFSCVPWKCASYAKFWNEEVFRLIIRLFFKGCSSKDKDQHSQSLFFLNSFRSVMAQVIYHLKSVSYGYCNSRTYVQITPPMIMFYSVSSLQEASSWTAIDGFAPVSSVFSSRELLHLWH